MGGFKSVKGLLAAYKKRWKIIKRNLKRQGWIKIESLEQKIDLYAKVKKTKETKRRETIQGWWKIVTERERERLADCILQIKR